MSHYAVAVVHRKNQSVEEMLDPFYEGLEVAPCIEYTKEQAIAEARTYPGNAHKSDEKCWEWMAVSYPDDLMDEDGNLYTRYNPSSKWDWYVIGGRWDGFFRLENGERVNEAKVSEIDFEPDPEQYSKWLRMWDVIVNGEEPANDDEKFAKGFYKPAYYTKRYDSREQYAVVHSTPTPGAILTPEGNWLEPGQMGSFGISAAEAEDEREWNKNAANMLRQYDKYYVTIVDCHI